MCNMSAPSHGSKPSDAIRKARAQGEPYVKKKRRLNAPNKKRGRGKRGETQSQPPVATRRYRDNKKSLYESEGDMQ